MVLVNMNKRFYVTRMCGRSGKYCRVPLQNGTGIFDAIGKAGTKAVLSSIGKNSGAYGGKQLAKLIQDKTGSKLLGRISKAALSSVGAFAGQKLGNMSGKLLGNTVFKEKGKENDNKKKERVSVSELMDAARNKLMGNSSEQAGQGINIMY